MRDTHLIGTPGYAAPEQLGFGASNTATDIYAIGMLMKALLTADTSLSTEYNGPLRHIIAKCTSLDPEKRYKNVRQLSNTLILCPWSYDDGKITITLSKLHCDIVSETADLSSGRLLFVSRSKNWAAETFEKLDNPSFSYESKALFAYDDNVILSPEGGFEFTAGGFTYHVPKHYTDFPDVTDHDRDRYIFINADAQERYVGQLYFFHDISFKDGALLEDYFKGLAYSFAAKYIDDIKTSDISSLNREDDVIYSCTFTGIYNTGFSGMAGYDAGGIIAFTYDPKTGEVVKILMAQRTDSTVDATDEFMDIIMSASK